MKCGMEGDEGEIERDDIGIDLVEAETSSVLWFEKIVVGKRKEGV